MGKFRKSSATSTHIWNNAHRFEHWYRDNTVYFITSKVRDAQHLFLSEQAKRVFWDRFEHWSSAYGFVPWITTLMSNHYHTLDYLKVGDNLGPFMQRFHGSVSKLVNDLLPDRHLPFWRYRGNRDYFDGCLRDENQVRRAYRYTLTQAVRARLVRKPEEYKDTRMRIQLDVGLARAIELNAIPIPVPYKRYERGYRRKSKD